MIDNRQRTELFVNSTDLSPPSHRFADLAEIVVLIALVFIGCPLNIASLSRSLRRFDHAVGQISPPGVKCSTRRLSQALVQSLRKGSSSRIFALILHLTVANLMILLVYGGCQIGWLITYSWLAGDWACRLMKFLHAFCFYGTSNLMVAFAFERLYIAVNVEQPHSWSGSSTIRQGMRALPWIGWMLAFASAIPQLFLWRTYAPYADSHPEWVQCIDVWSMLTQAGVGTASTEWIYVGIHLALVFWLPAAIIAGCYILIVARLSSKLQRNQNHLTVSRRRSNVAQFRCRAENWHKASCCSIDDGNDDPGRRQSVALLMEMPIVVESPRVFSVSVERKSLTNENLNAILVTTLTRARRSAVTKMTWVLCAYAISWAPYNIMAVLRYASPNSYKDFGMEYLYNFIVVNAVINPLLYGC